jgi:hypothetical protein
MDINQIIQNIKTRWDLNGYHDLTNDLTSVMSIGFTGGEGVAMTGKFIKDLKQSNPIAFGLIEGEFEEYLTFYPYLKLR